MLLMNEASVERRNLALALVLETCLVRLALFVPGLPRAMTQLRRY